MLLERRAVGRKTPKDGRLEVTAATAGYLRHLGSEFTVIAPAGRAAGRLEEMRCTCGKGPVEGGHVHHFVVCHQFERLRAGDGVRLDLVAAERALRVEAGPTAGTNRAVEDAALRAWPALEQETVDGWLLRAAGGFTGRANSVQPLGPSRTPLAEHVAACVRWYAAAGLRCRVRVTPFAESRVEPFLAGQRWERSDDSVVMTRALDDAPAGAPSLEELDPDPWIAAWVRLIARPSFPDAFPALLARVPHPRVLACARDEAGEVVAVGMGVVVDGLLGLFDLATEARARGRGHGTGLIRGLLDWGRSAGARAAYLQVVAGNAGARRLYERLGFEPAYEYWYRNAPDLS